MLNPSSVLMRRQAGVVRRGVGAESLVGPELTDDPWLYTGGGTTELLLELLFDLAVAGSSIDTDDVRDITGPLWRLAETSSLGPERRLPVVRLIWGKAWNVPGLVVEVAERLEAFAPSGAPRRSLMSMRFVRVREQDDLPAAAPGLSAGELAAVQQIRTGTSQSATDLVTMNEPTLPGRVDITAFRAYGSETLWRLVLAANAIDNPFDDLTGRPLTLLPRARLGGTRE